MSKIALIFIFAAFCFGVSVGMRLGKITLEHDGWKPSTRSTTQP